MKHKDEKGVEVVKRRTERTGMTSRRNMLTRSIALLALLGGSLGGVIAGGSGASAASKGSLHIYAWAGEVPATMVKAFEKATGITVTVDTATSNEAMLAKIAAGNSGYDVVEPSQYAVQELKQQKLIVPISHAKLVGFSDEGTPYQSPSYDTGDKYSLPWLTGSTGLIYNSTCTGGPVNSWSVLWNPAFTGKLYVLDNELSAYITGLQYLGFKASSTNKAEIAQATAALVAQKPLLAGYNSTNSAQLVASGQACAAEVYSGGTTAAAVATNPSVVHYILPHAGGTIWVDSWSIVKGSKNVSNAYKWLNFALQPKNAASAAISAQEATTNHAAYKYIPAKDLNNSAIYTPLASAATADFILDPGSALTYFNSGWLQVQAG